MSPDAQRDILAEADEVLARLDRASVNVIISAPEPVFAAPPFRCSDWFNAANPVCDPGFVVEREYLEAHRRPVMELLSILRDRHSKIVVWDTLPVLCGKALCSAFDGDLPLFFDGDHLSAHGNRVLYVPFRNLLAWLWGERR